MNPVTVDIKDKLVAAGVGTFAATSGWGIFLSLLPDSPDTVIALYTTSGLSPEGCMNQSAKQLLRPSFSVRVRGTTFLATYTKMREVIDTLGRIGPWSVVGCKYSDVFQTNDEFLFERDENGRYVWSVDFYAVRKET